ncbi:MULTISPECIES: polysaccharide pyruvyl transferase family protein [Bacillota]|jgi:hypothetical protein|uniref:Polysaccharide pyruvyl transferase family protein n=3 Tax=Erysipelotrichaceae TaxID=128827 RepID=A0A7G9GPC4_9FIRM|nr:MULTISPECIES: polysaccharide pyruvyl transferase family protein [Bacillota]QNM12656.1 polysaccharide pyruvyl transferase family protein [[Eubacterium] hominis]MCH4284030.1 polysaccharide pyruvyl transferase family protein [Amedibacillus hominis]RGB57713.1 polysaccharide pyruvyl transferase family protein [Absiella sp. AM22-9]RGB62181.1 polysaccharide pyruvyl transferase family protein [Absiella sp. AM10-20]RHU06622.1 polysaccharide pyruvyl transferase family protein [Absiella sp. AM27-20]
MKKIGLAVCYDTKNYGSQLQVLATLKKIEELGFETEIIRYKKKISPTFIVQTLPRLFNIPFIQAKINSKKKRNRIDKHDQLRDDVKKRNDRFNKFVTDYFTNLSEQYNGWESLVRKSNQNYDTFLCGSDQLWLPHNLGSHFYTLEFANDDKKKVAYATSFGVSEIPNNLKKGYKKFLNRFQFLSTREIAGQEIIKELTGKNAKVVCDPTLLFNSEQWMKILPEEKVISEKYIFCYFLGDNNEHRNQAEILSQKTGYKIVTIPFLDNFVERDLTFGDYKMFDIDTKDFVNLIRNAEYVLTDSFHGSIFSILNHKKFITFNRYTSGKGSRNSRIDSLCHLLNLNDRRFEKNILDNIFNDIDYDNVEIKLNELRNASISYLIDSLGATK